jgi:protein TonB
MPQAPWHKNAQTLWRQLHRTAQSWLNPQPVTPVQAPVTHENFGQAGDEYKLPVAENIPDATTDPTQIRVLPVVDPTAKQPNANASNTGESASTDPAQASGAQDSPAQPQGNQSIQPVAANNSPGQPPASNAFAERPSEATVAPSVAPTVQPVPLKNPPPRYVPASTSKTNSAIPSSLKSQMASMTPDASGNKPVEAALPSIEPVNLPEATARGLLIDQPPAAYPETAKGQQGTVILQVLIGRDGTVQDAKFMQGSLVFARVAIDAVKQWKFKPYMMNNRATSTQTQLTISFKPAS